MSTTWYLKPDTAPDASAVVAGAVQDGGTAPTTANSTAGWTVAKTASARYGAFKKGTKQASTVFGTTVLPVAATVPDTVNGNSFRTENPYTGSFAATTWTFNFGMISTTASSQVDAIRIRVYKSDAIGGGNATELTSAVLVTNNITANTSTVQNASVTWSPGAITLQGEYLFFTVAMVTATAGGSNSSDWVFKVGTNSTITVPAFTGGSAASKTATLTDTFDSGTLSANWASSADTGYSVTAGVTSGSGQALKLAGSTSVAGWARIGSASFYDLTSSSIYAKLVQPPQGTTIADGASSTLFITASATPSNLDNALQFGWGSDGTNKIVWSVYHNSASFDHFTADTVFNSTNNVWFKISESGGTLTFATAPDAGNTPGTFTTWGTLAVSTLKFSVASVKIGIVSGSGGTPPSGYTNADAYWDGFNTVSNDAAASGRTINWALTEPFLDVFAATTQVFITGSATLTEGFSDTFSANVNLIVTANWAITEGFVDTFAATVQVAATITAFALTETFAADTFAANITTSPNITWAIVENFADTFAATAQVKATVTSFALTEPFADVFAATAQLTATITSFALTEGFLDTFAANIVGSSTITWTVTEPFADAFAATVQVKATVTAFALTEPFTDTFAATAQVKVTVTAMALTEGFAADVFAASVTTTLDRTITAFALIEPFTDVFAANAQLASRITSFALTEGFTDAFAVTVFTLRTLQWNITEPVLDVFRANAQVNVSATFTAVEAFPDTFSANVLVAQATRTVTFTVTEQLRDTTFVNVVTIPPRTITSFALTETFPKDTILLFATKGNLYKAPATDAEYFEWLKDSDSAKCLLVEATANINGVETTMYLSTVGFVTSPTDSPANTLYNSHIVGGCTVDAEISLDGSASLTLGDIEISNVDGVHDSWLGAGYIWANRAVNFYLGDLRWHRSDFRLVFSGVVSDIASRDHNTINLVLMDKLQKLNTTVSSHILSNDGTNTDKVVPLAFGEVSNVTPLLYDPGTLSYWCNDGLVNGFIEVRDEGVPVPFSFNLTDGTIRVLATPAGNITVSLQGDAASGSYLTTATQIVKRLATGFGVNPFTNADLDLTSLATFDLANPQPVGVYLDKRANVLEVIQDVAASIGATPVMTTLGKLRLVKIDFPAASDVTTVITKSNFYAKSFDIVERMPVMAAYKLGYCKNWTIQDGLLTGLPPDHKQMFSDEFMTISYSEDTVATNYKLPKQPPEQVDTYLLRTTDASDECARRLRLWSVPRTVYGYQGFPELLLQELGQVQNIKHDRFGFTNGKPALVIGLAKDFYNMTVGVRVLA